MARLIRFMVIAALTIFIFGSYAKADLAGPQKGRIAGELIFWWPAIDGEVVFDGVKVGAMGLEVEVPGTDLDLDDIMGLDQDVLTIEIGLWINPLKRHRLSLFWFMDSRTGSKSLDVAELVNVDGVEIWGEVDSKLEFQRWKLLYEAAILRNDLGRVALSSGVVYLDAIASISGTEKMTGLRESTGDRIQAPLPVVGAAAELHIPFLIGLGVFLEGASMGMSYEKISVSYLEARGGINFKTRFVFAQAGYQYMNMTGKAFDTIEVSFNLQGPFASIGAKF